MGGEAEVEKSHLTAGFDGLPAGLFNKSLISVELSSGRQMNHSGSCGEGHLCDSGDPEKCNIIIL